jgi:hypothetical protein
VLLPSDTHAPGVVTPIALRKKLRVPELACGRNGWIGAFLPPTWPQFVMLHE